MSNINKKYLNLVILFVLTVSVILQVNLFSKFDYYINLLLAANLDFSIIESICFKLKSMSDEAILIGFASSFSCLILSLYLIFSKTIEPKKYNKKHNIQKKYSDNISINDVNFLKNGYEHINLIRSSIHDADNNLKKIKEVETRANIMLLNTKIDVKRKIYPEEAGAELIKELESIVDQIQEVFLNLSNDINKNKENSENICSFIENLLEPLKQIDEKLENVKNDKQYEDA